MGDMDAEVAAARRAGLAVEAVTSRTPCRFAATSPPVGFTRWLALAELPYYWWEARITVPTTGRMPGTAMAAWSRTPGITSRWAR